MVGEVAGVVGPAAGTMAVFVAVVSTAAGTMAVSMAAAAGIAAKTIQETAKAPGAPGAQRRVPSHRWTQMKRR